MATAPVDIPIQVKGLSDLQKLERRMEALEREVTRLQKASEKTGKALPQVGKGAKGAAVGVNAFGAAIKSALGPITLALSAVSGLGAAFNTLKGQDFAEAKFESLGGNATQLVTNLKAVSNELQGSASVAELTAAAYDVASAGFSSAAEASLVLKAASLGATGGFSDINTVGNAATSVLNAYGQSATDAAKLVDQFIQTQNDGKIVVEQYAQNIGKVASAAAGLGVPLSEVNAVIAQSTAAGVQAEVAFTGLKGALARLASGEASKALKDYNIEIDAASIKSDGLFGTLKKLEGLDTGTIFKALGTEAGPALLPVIQNLERYEELIKNQEQANGVAAAAAATAAGTIEGAWKRVTVAFQNLFADQSELGQIIRGTLLAAAATVEALGAAFTLAIAPVRALIEVITGIVSALTGVKDGEAVLQSFTQKWFEVIAAVQDVANTIVAIGNVVGQYIGALVQQVAQWFSGLWNSISGGVQSVVGAITGAFAAAFNGAKSIIEGFWNSLPGWLKGALSTAASVAGGVTNAVRGALEKVVGDVQEAKAKVEITVPDAPKTPALNAVIPTGGLTGGGGSSGGGSSGVDKAAQDAARLAEEIAKASQNAADLVARFTEGSRPLQEQVEDAQKLVDMINSGVNSDEAKQDIERARELSDIRLAGAEAIADLQKIENLGAKELQEAEAAINEQVNERIANQQRLNKLKDQTKTLTDQERAAEQAAKDAQAQSDQLAEGLAGDLSSGLKDILVTAIKGGDVKQAAMQLVESLANRFLDAAFSQVEDALSGLFKGFLSGEEKAATTQLSAGQIMQTASQTNMQAAQMMQQAAAQMGGAGGGGGGLGSLFGGGGLGGLLGSSGGIGGYSIAPSAVPLTSGMSFFATGGVMPPNSTALVGENGPELISTGGTPARVSNTSQTDEMLNRYGASGSTMTMAPVQTSFELQTTVINGVEYATVDQVRAMGQSATRQGAKLGEANALKGLRNRRSTRQSLGI